MKLYGVLLVALAGAALYRLIVHNEGLMFLALIGIALMASSHDDDTPRPA